MLKQLHTNTTVWIPFLNKVFECQDLVVWIPSESNWRFWLWWNSIDFQRKNWQSQAVSSSSYRSKEQGRTVLARLTFSQWVSHQSQFGDQGHLAIPSLLCYLQSRTDVFTWSDPSLSDTFSHLWWDKSSTVLCHAGAKASQMDHKRCGPFSGGRFCHPFSQ